MVLELAEPSPDPVEATGVELLAEPSDPLAVVPPSGLLVALVASPFADVVEPFGYVVVPVVVVASVPVAGSEVSVPVPGGLVAWLVVVPVTELLEPVAAFVVVSFDATLSHPFAPVARGWAPRRGAVAGLGRAGAGLVKGGSAGTSGTTCAGIVVYRVLELGPGPGSADAAAADALLTAGLAWRCERWCEGGVIVC